MEIFVHEKRHILLYHSPIIMHFSAEPGTNKTGTAKVYQDTASKLRVNIVTGKTVCVPYRSCAAL